MRRRGVGEKIPWGSLSEGSTWEAWLPERGCARRAEPGRKRGDSIRSSLSSLSPSVTTCGGDQRASYDLTVPLFPRRGHYTPETETTVAEPHMPFTDQEIEEEEAHFASVVAAFRNYTAHSVKLETTD